MSTRCTPRSTRTPWRLSLCLALLGASLASGACSDDDGDDDGAAPRPDLSTSDAGVDSGQPDVASPPADLGSADGAAQPEDATPLDLAPAPDAADSGAPTDLAPPADGGPSQDAGPPPDLGPLPELNLNRTLRSPADPLAEGDPASCPVVDAERCADGLQQRCAIYDTAASAFVAEPDALLRRAYLYDRWYDLYGSPDGQTGERAFTQDMPPEAPEALWSAREHFNTYAGRGDSAIWTGVALHADTFRYAVTGTEADYQRMEARVRTLLTMFDVTGAPGYLARYHFLYAPAGTPPNPDHFVVIEGRETLDDRDMPVLDPAAVPDLPAAYREGVPGADGALVQGTPMWHGHPSIDQYTGPMLAFPVVYDLLRDEELKARIVRHLTCYLHRLQRIEIVHIQDNEQIHQLVTDYFAGGGLTLDPDDIDLLDTDRVVAFALRGINPDNYADYDRSCRAGVARQPDLLLDARDPDFVHTMVELAMDMVEGDEPRPGQIDHIYVPTVRGGDASHMLHLAAMAYYFTGEQQYLEFLFHDLVADMRAPEVALTMEALRTPDWCLSYYGDHITYGTHWQLIQLLGDSPLREQLIRALHVELWQKALHNHHSAKFNVMYASVGEHPELPARQEALDIAVRQLERFGGGRDVIDSPRRTYQLDATAVLQSMAELGIGTRCPTEEQRERCETGETVLGISLGGENISHVCDGRPRECVMEDGTCTFGLAAEGLPPRLRRYADFMWQRSPFHIGERRGDDGRKQSPGRDLAEPYWMARYYGFIQAGASTVLAWQDLGPCAE